MAVVVEVLSPAVSVTNRENRAVVIEVLRTTQAPINTTTGAAVVEVVGPGRVQNAIVSPTPPAFPYEGQIWIDVS